MGVGPDSQGCVAYTRRRKRDRPLCQTCRAPYRAKSTRGRVTYYYPTCTCGAGPVKVVRVIADPHAEREGNS